MKSGMKATALLRQVALAVVAISPMFLTACGSLSSKAEKRVITVRTMVDTVASAVGMTCETLDIRNSGLPADQQIQMQNATLTLLTTQALENGREVSLLVVSGKSSRKTSSGDSLEVKLGRINAGGAYGALDKAACQNPDSDDKHIACLALAAIDGTSGLKAPLSLKGFTVVIDFAAENVDGVGLKLEFTDVGAGANTSKSVKNGHQLKLEFGPPPKKSS